MTGSTFDEYSAPDLYGEFPESVRGIVQELEKQGLEWNEVGAALAMAPTAGVALKGGGGWRENLWDSVKGEFHDFLCSNSAKYQDLRGEWGELKEESRHLALASLSGAIGAHLGVSAGLVAPLVVWLVLVTVRIGREGLCKAIGEATALNAG